MHHRRYLQIIKMFKTMNGAPYSAIHVLEQAASKNRAMLQKRSEITRNEIKTFVGSEYKLTATGARLLKTAGLA